MKTFVFLFLTLCSISVFSEEKIANSDVHMPKNPDLIEPRSLLDQKYLLYPHKRNYLLPLSYVWNPSEELYTQAKAGSAANRGDYYRKPEAEFQISFFITADRSPFNLNGDLVLAYTHQSWWQVYNSDWSKPFRETNYSPELFFRTLNSSEKQFLGLDLSFYDIGYVHQSNGQIQELSRSWDRLFFRTLLTDESLTAIFTLWVRIPETGSKDENADIAGYRGLGEIEVKRSFGKINLESKLPLARTPGIEVNLSYPWQDNLRWFISGRTGYGHSLIEYDKDTSRLGIGIALE